MTRPFWAQPGERVARELSVDPRVGLSEREATLRMQRHGSNRLREVRPRSWLRILLDQFASLIVALLALAAVVAFFFREWLDGTAIAVVLVVNALLGFVTEIRAVRSMEALRNLGSVRTRVRRDAEVVEIDATDLVPGDVVLLEAGDVVTADLRLVDASKLEVDESALTGESLPVSKSVAAVDERCSIADRTSMLFKGTALTRGVAEGLTVATGMQTELGRIAQLVQEAEQRATPLEERLSSLGRWLVWVTIVIATLTAVIGITAGKPVFLMIETGIALAVAAIPEGLPIVATIALARGMVRMARKKALVNRLSAVETLGETGVIFSDKTGTLTENRMEVRCLALADGRVEVLRDEEKRFRQQGHALEVESSPVLRAAIEAAVLCNNATFDEAQGEGLGDPTEVALLALGSLAGLGRARLVERLPELREEAFDSTHRRMATVHQASDGLRIAVKGAAESVLAASSSFMDAQGNAQPLTSADRERWMQLLHELATDGLRVLAVAQRESASPPERIYEDLTLLALLGLADPPRLDVPAALAQCRAAGIRVVMVTGDHADTAASIGRAVGLVEGQEVRVVQGAELETLDERAAAEREELLDAPVYARVSPEQKLDLIAAYQRKGQVVAMTGDGVNDAPALRKADIGIAMGQRGTQVAREAADMVLTDDSFATIVTAVEQGRIIFANIRKFVFYLLSCNVSEVMVVSMAGLVGAPLPLLPLQILFLNLVTDVFPALALSFGEGDAKTLQQPPRPPEEAIISRRGWLAILAFGLTISLSVLASLLLALHWLEYDTPRAVTLSFLTLAIAQLLHVFNVRSRSSALVSNEITRNPWVWGAMALCCLLLLASVYLPILSRVLNTVPPGSADWALVAGMSLVPLLLGQVWLILRKRKR